MNERFLPVGSVVKLKDGFKTLIITGFCVSSPEKKGQLFDYAGCFYPEGIISNEYNLIFNHDQIEKVLFKGFVNNDEIEFKKKLNEALTTGQIDGKPIDFFGDSSDDAFPAPLQ